MKENVGREDQVMRLLLGPAVMALGFWKLGARRGELPGLAALVAGALIVDSGITRTCPVSAVLGIDTRGLNLVGGYRLEAQPAQ